MLDWPIWTQTLGFVVVAAGAKLSQVLLVRSSSAELVKVGTKCPKCLQPLHRSGQSTAEAQEQLQWQTVMSGYCPRCFEQIGPAKAASNRTHRHRRILIARWPRPGQGACTGSLR